MTGGGTSGVATGAIDGRVKVRAALAQLLGETSPALAFADLFGPELDTYAEIIVGPGGVPAGFMTRGEGPGFTEKVRLALAELRLPAAAREHHLALARLFDHRRGFAKVEWHRGAGGVEPLAAVYFRRRPRLVDVLGALSRWSVPDDARRRMAELATALGKDSVHFVSAAFRPGHPVHHKLYFSQWVTPARRAAVDAGIAAVFGQFGFGEGAREAWRVGHDACVAPGESTLFVSTSCSVDGASPTFKIDYPALTAAQATSWLPAEARGAAIGDVERTRRLAGAERLTFLGVRFAPDRPFPTLKYYGDVPGSR